jgi:broad specificity phosphatase PhoE
MTKKYITLFLIILGFQSCQITRDSEFFTIYLVRHSEKEVSSDDYIDPPLTECGEQRSESLSYFLSDVPLEAIYSTNYKRTKKTASPIATSKGMRITEYNSNELSDFSKLLIDSKQNALVVGHSNTTGVLAGLLAGEEIGEFGLDIYDRVYQISIYKNKKQLHLLHMDFNCIYSSKSK